MSFDRLHRVVIAATMLLGLSILWMSGEFSDVGMIVAATAVIAGLWLHRWTVRLTGTVLNATVVAVGAGAVYLAFATENYLYYAILYAVFLGVLRATMLFAAADFMQAHALSFLHVMAGAVVNPGLSFGVLLFPYIVGLTLSLLMTNIRRGVEQDPVPGPGASSEVQRARLARRDLIGARFLGMTVAVTSAVFLMSLVFFFVFPRVGLGFFATQGRPGIAISGFSDTVTLGEFRTVLEDPEVVARVRFLDAAPSIPVRLRGQSLDTYDGRSWSKTTKRLWELRMDLEGRHRLDPAGPDPDSAGIRAVEVYLEPLSGPRRVLFSPPMPVAFRRPSDALEALRPRQWRFGMDAAGDVVVQGPPNVSIQYTVYFDARPPDPAQLRAAPEELPGFVAHRYLQVPDLDPRVAALAREVSKTAQTTYDKAAAIEDFLRTSFEYSVDSKHGDQDPLADFLLRDRTGHCEYFASAMVVMLRSLGVPARIVEGLYGGEVNEYGGYVALRKADAHAWVEVYFPRTGWVTFDPTPPVALELRSGRSFWQGFRAAVDAVKLWWYRWVIEYDLQKQMDFVMAVLRPRGGGAEDAAWKWRDFHHLKRQIRRMPIARWALTAVGLAAVAVAGLAWIRRRRGQRRPERLGDPDDPAVQAWKRLNRVARRAGLQRRTTETQLEFARRVANTIPEAAPAVEALAWAYLRAVFWGRERTRDDPRPLLAEVERAIRTRSSER